MEVNVIESTLLGMDRRLSFMLETFWKCNKTLLNIRKLYFSKDICGKWLILFYVYKQIKCM